MMARRSVLLLWLRLARITVYSQKIFDLLVPQHFEGFLTEDAEASEPA